MRIIKSIFFFSVWLTFYSCEKVIDIQVRESDTKYVIEGIVTNGPGCKVYITRTKPFNENNDFEKVSGAMVKVKDNNIEHTLIESAPGVYETIRINGTPDHVYRLAVTINNQVFTAVCSMPQPVLMDTLYISPGPFGQFKFATVSLRIRAVSITVTALYNIKMQ